MSNAKIIILAFIINTVFGFFIEDIFVKKLSNKRYMLRKLWRRIFYGSTRGRILSTKDAILLIIFEILFIGISTTVTYHIFDWLIGKTIAFYYPIFIFSLISLYFYTKVRFAPKIKWYDWVIYFISIILMVFFILLIIKYGLFGYT